MKYSAILIIIAALLVSCRSSDHFSDGYKGPVLEFGQGGGFTGQYESYALLRNGDIFRKTATDSTWVKTAGVKKVAAVLLFRMADSIGIAKTELNAPGNMTFFINWKTRKKSNSLKWGSTEAVPPAGVSELYQKLYNLVKE